MNATIHPSQLRGSITAPPSKSSLQRACAAALLRKGETRIKNRGDSNDDLRAIDIIQKLGAKVKISEEELQIESNGVFPIANALHCGESGLCMRLFTFIAALSNEKVSIMGEGTLLSRPNNLFFDILPKLNVEVCVGKEDLLFTVKGPLVPKNIEIEGSLSSQFLTGLLMAYSALDAKDVVIKVKNLKSKPYINLTLEVLREFGLKVPINRNYGEFYFSTETNHTNFNSGTKSYTVENDWSGGAFLLVAGALAGPLTVMGLDLHSQQPDKKIMDMLLTAKADIVIEENAMTIKPSNLVAFECDATDCPDLFPPLAVLAAYCNGVSKIKGVSRLYNKESNRAQSLQVELGKMGVAIEIQEDLMLIQGCNSLKGALINCHQDHRIAMACSIAALKATTATCIESAEAVNKSYPHFFNHLEKLGAAVSLKK